MTALAAAAVSVALGRRLVLHGVDLAPRPGALTVVIGPNGAGKSTLLRTLAGLSRPDRGSVSLDGVPLERLSAAERARSIAYLPQGGTIAWPMPVAQVVALGRIPHGEAPERLRDPGRAAVAQAIARVGLAGFEDRAATELSGGERARVLLARALAVEAPVLLADEPVAALDPRHQLLVLDVLTGLARRGGTVVAVMHDLALAARYADEIVLLQDGAVQARGTPAGVLTEARLEASFGILARVRTLEGRLVVVAERPVGDAAGESA
jgi:iron complex transport system ATP-binding protein